MTRRPPHQFIADALQAAPPGRIVTAFLAAFAITAVYADSAMAVETLGEIATRLKGDIGNLKDLLGTVALLMGVSMGIGAGLKFKAHGENPNQTPISQPLWRAAVAAMLIGLGSMLGVGMQTLFGNQNTGLTGLGG